MEKLKFKTTIKCGGCIAKVTPYLNEAVGENKWQVDITDPQKILTVEHAEETKVKEAVERAGFKAEPLSPL